MESGPPKPPKILGRREAKTLKENKTPVFCWIQGHLIYSLLHLFHSPLLLPCKLLLEFQQSVHFLLDFGSVCLFSLELANFLTLLLDLGFELVDFLRRQFRVDSQRSRSSAGSRRTAPFLLLVVGRLAVGFPSILLSAVLFPELLFLLFVEPGEKVLGFADPVPSLNVVASPANAVDSPFVYRSLRRVDLPQDALRGGGHEGVKHGREKVAEVERKRENRVAASPLAGKQVVVELVVLQVQVTAGRERHGRRQPLTLSAVLHVVHVLSQQGIDVLEESLVGRVLELLGVRSRCDRSVFGFDKFHNTVDKVAQVCKQLAVVSLDKVLPRKLTVAGLGSVREEVVAPHFDGNTGFHDVVAKDADASGLGEFAVFVVEVFCERREAQYVRIPKDRNGKMVTQPTAGRNAPHHGVGITRSFQRAREDDRVERHVVLAHELVQLDLVRVLPPLFPLGGVVGRNRKVSNRRVEPNVKDLLPESVHRHRDTPFEITGDTPRGKAGLEPRHGDGPAICRPFAPIRDVFGPLFVPLLQFGEVEEKMARFFLDRRVAVEFATRIDEFGGVEELLASVALVTTSIVVAAVGASSFNKTVGKETRVLVTPELGHGVFESVVVLVRLEEDVLANGRLPFCRCSSKVIKVDSEPLVGLHVKLVVLVTKLPWAHAFLERLCFRGRAVFVRPTDIQGVVAPKTTETRENVRRENRADDVAQVRNVVNIGKSRGNENVALAVLGQANIKGGKVS